MFLFLTSFSMIFSKAYLFNMLPGWGLCSKIFRFCSSINMTLDPEVLPLFSFVYPNKCSNLIASSNVKSVGRLISRSISFSLVPICKCN